MKRLLENSRYLTFVAVLACLAAAVAACLLGVIRTIKLFTILGDAAKDSSYAVVTLVEIADIFLLAASLLIVGLSLYELFVGKLDLPSSLVVHSFSELKDKLAGVIVIVTAVSFLKALLDERDAARDVMFVGLACAAVIVALGIYSRLSDGSAHYSSNPDDSHKT